MSRTIRPFESLQPVPYQDPDQREALRPKKDDVVLFEGVKYIVEEVGLKYVRMCLFTDSRVKGFAKMNQISKWFPALPEPDWSYVEDPRQLLISS